MIQEKMLKSNDIIIRDERTQQLQELENILPYHALVEKRQHAEEDGQSDFHYFNDQEILSYYLQHQNNIDPAKGKAERTIISYKQELMAFISHIIEYQDSIGIHFGEIKEGSLFKNLKASHLEKYQKWLIETYPYLIGRNSSYAPATIARKNAIIKHFLNFLYESHYINQDITRFMKTTTVSTDERPNRDLGPDEVLKLLDFFSEEVDHPVIFGILHVLVTTGVRNEELCKATIGDIDYDSYRNKYYLEVKGKGNKNRIVPLLPKVIQSINRLRESRNVSSIHDSELSAPLIVTSTGKAYSPSYLAQYLHKVIKRTQLPMIERKTITPHTFRHAFAILSYHAAIDVYTIMRSLGHEHIETTMIYLPKEMEKDQHAAMQWKNTSINKYL